MPLVSIVANWLEGWTEAPTGPASGGSATSVVGGPVTTSAVGGPSAVSTIR